MAIGSPAGRNGQTQTDCHSNLKNLDNLRTDSALKVPLRIAESKERVRSAVNRATRSWAKVATASDVLFCMYGRERGLEKNYESE